MSDDANNEGLPNAGYRHDFSIDGSKKTRFHLLQDHLPENPRGEVYELVRREDHQRKVAEERSRKYDEGFFEGRKAQREDVKALIQSKGFTMQQEIRKGRHEKAINLIDELLEDVEGEASE